jgi:hypothetical protein
MMNNIGLFSLLMILALFGFSGGYHVGWNQGHLDGVKESQSYRALYGR